MSSQRRVPGRRVARFLVGLGLLMVLVAIHDWLKPRARYVNSQPAPASTAADQPPAVIIRFSDRLDSSSTIAVVCTVSLSPSGDEIYPAQEVTSESGLDSADPQQTALRAELQPGLPQGIYRVSWNAVSARGRAECVGAFYFGIGMPAPADVFGGGPLYERDIGLGTGLEGTRSERATLLAAGFLLILLGLLLPRARRSR